MDILTYAKSLKDRAFDAKETTMVLCEIYGLNKKRPFVINSASYKKSKGIKLYRGLNCSSETFNNYVEEFAFGNMIFINRLAVLGSGFYFSDKKVVANYYANKSKLNKFKKTIISAKMLPDAKLITKRKLRNEFDEKYDTIVNELYKKFNGLIDIEDAEFLANMLRNSSEYICMAIILGYDGVVSRYKTKIDANIYLVFNREKLIINESEINRVKKPVEPIITLE